MKRALVVAIMAVVTFVGLHSKNVEAQDDANATTAPIAWSLSVGGSAIMGFQSAQPLLGYMNTGLVAVIPVHGKLALIPSVGFEVSPKAGNFGATGTVALDYLFYKSIAFDAIVGVVHDEDPLLEQERDEATTAYMVIGPGLTFLMPNNMAISPAILYTISCEGLGQVLTVGLNVSVPIP